MMVCEVHIMLDLHLNKVLLHWRSIMFSILYHTQPFFNNYNFPLIPCINFSHLANNLCMPIPIIFLIVFFTWGVHNNFIQNWFTTGDPFVKTLFTLTQFHVLYLITTTHPTCVFPSLIDDMHIVGLISNMWYSPFYDCM
jgi:hypothetical protein